MRAIFVAAAAGRAGAREHLFGERFEAVFAFLRMALSDPAAAERLAVEVLVTAVQRHEECPAATAEIDPWLRGIALEQLAGIARLRPGGETPPEARNPNGRRLAQVLSGVSDTNLAALVRALDATTRQVIVLGLMAEIDDETVAAIVGIPEADVGERLQRGLGEIARLLESYDDDTNEIGWRARENAYHLRPQRGPGADGMLVVRGDRMMVTPGPTSGFLYMALRAFARVLGRLAGHPGPAPLDDDVGAPRHRPVPVKRTATSKEFDQPQRTPSLTEYRTPRSTPGMAGFRAPKGTPSTARISSPRATAKATASAYGGMRKKF